MASEKSPKAAGIWIDARELIFINAKGVKMHFETIAIFMLAIYSFLSAILLVLMHKSLHRLWICVDLLIKLNVGRSKKGEDDEEG